VHFLQLQIDADFSHVVTITPNPVLVTSDLLEIEPKISRLRHSVEDYLLCQLSSHSDHGFSFYRANTEPHTHIHTDIHCDRLIAISARPYDVVIMRK